MTVAAVDRLVHHATILMMNVESYCQHTATTRPRQKAASQHETVRGNTTEQEKTSKP